PLPASLLLRNRFRCPLRPVASILRGTDVRNAPLVAVPAVETFHLEGPETGGQVADHDQAICIADLHAPGTIHHAADTRLGLEPSRVRALAGVEVAHGVGVGGIHHVHDL